MNYTSHIPLIGGFTLAAINVFNKYPEHITSYSPFYNNDKLLLDYLQSKGQNIPYIQLDKGFSDLASKKIDLVIGVPPCAGLSSASSLKHTTHQDSPVNDWMTKSAEYILSTYSPEVYVFENAPRLFTNVGETVRNKLMEYAKHYNYSITFYKTNTIYHSVPQNRPRTYCIFYKGDKAPYLNNIKKPLIHIKDYLKQIPKSASLQDKYLCAEPSIENYEIFKFLNLEYGKSWRNEMLKQATHITSFDFLKRRNLLYKYKEYLESFLNTPNFNCSALKDINHVIKKTEMGKNFRLSYQVLCVDKDYVYAVIGEMMERNVHPTENRRLNIREYMHLMGLPNDFEIEDKRNYVKLTQNVPVATSSDILLEVKGILNQERRLSTERFLFIDNTKEIKSNKTKKLF